MSVFDHITRHGKSAARRGVASVAAWALAVTIHAGAAQALSIELKDAAPDRIERQRAAAVGRLPLPGTPDVSKTDERLAAKGFAKGSALMIRIFKAESELEIWLEKDGRFEHFATYPICHWSGSLGPKQSEGDKQTPEGFYTITSRQLHHIGRWPRSLNLGFPNAYDKAMKRSGSYILVHGGCSSVGCFAMTNPVISEIYGLSSAALRGGQRHIPTHVFPFRMTDANFAKYKSSEWSSFWANLKEGYDSFEKTRRPPRVSVCNDRYHIEDASPSEAGADRPLAVCGPTAADIQSRDKSASLVLLADRPRMPSPNEMGQMAAPALGTPLAGPLTVALLSGAARTTQPTPEQAITGLVTTGWAMYELVPNLNPPPAPQERTVNGRGKPPCNLGLASCRKFVALKAGKRARLAEAARRKNASRLALRQASN